MRELSFYPLRVTATGVCSCRALPLLFMRLISLLRVKIAGLHGGIRRAPGVYFSTFEESLLRSMK